MDEKRGLTLSVTLQIAKSQTEITKKIFWLFYLIVWLFFYQNINFFKNLLNLEAHCKTLLVGAASGSRRWWEKKRLVRVWDKKNIYRRFKIVLEEEKKLKKG